MKFDSNDFKKSSKRYANRHSLSLSEAQQSFSEVLGFKTTHEALKRLAATDEDPASSCVPAISAAPSGAFWCDLTLPEFKLLFECLFLQNYGRNSQNIQSDHAKLLVHAILGVIESEGLIPMRAMHGANAPESTAPLGTMELLGYLEIEAVTAIHRRLLGSKEYKPMIEWPVLQRPFFRYTQSLPGYNPHKSTKFMYEASSHHLRILAELSRVFDLLLAIEANGGAASCHTSSGTKNIYLQLQHLMLKREPPESSASAIRIREAADLAELYPVKPMPQALAA